MIRWPLLVACLVACRGKDTPPPTPAPSGPSAKPAAPVPRPELPPVEEAGVAPVTPAQKFAAEPVDRSWKVVTESELRGKLAHVHAGPAQLDCRQTTCEVTLTGSSDDLAAAMHDLQQLQSIAQSVLLTQPEPASGGKLALRAYLRFDRSQ